MFTFTHSIHFRSGDKSLPYRSVNRWKTAKGALNAAERLARDLDQHYEADKIAMHRLVVIDLDNGSEVLSMAA